MANAVYPKYKEAMLGGAANVGLLGGNVKAILINTSLYTYAAAHQFLSDIAVGARTSISAALTGATVTNGTFLAANAIFALVTGATSQALVLYIDTGVEATSRLVAYLDTNITGLPITPNGGNITSAWDATGIFTL